MSATLDDRGAGEAETEVPADHRLLSHLTALDRMIRLTDLADAKVAPLLAAQATVAAVSVTQVHKLLDLVGDGTPGEIVAVALLAVLYLSCTAFSTAVTVRVFIPKGVSGERSLLYFADIASMTKEAFIEQSSQQTVEQIERDALEQTHIVAQIVVAKFDKVRLAFLTMVGGLVGWLGLMALANY